MSGFVYLIGPSNWSEGCVKIGHTRTAVKKRLDGLQTGCPFPLSIYGYFEGDRALEAAFHEAFTPLHIRGEWFRMDAKLLDLISELNSTTYGRSPYPTDQLWQFVRDVLNSDVVPEHWQDLGDAWIDSIDMGVLASYECDRAWAAYQRERLH